MCLWVKNTTPKVANKDIICYKICHKNSKGDIISVINEFKYDILREYNNNILLNNNKYFYMFFIDSITTNSNNEIALGPNLFHSYKIEHYPGFNSPKVCLKCIIPKGAYYWEDKDCYASSQIKILEET